MPIRINLLAEQQAAEEARRRDPVKRAIWIGGGLVAAVVLWSVSLQLQLMNARSELTGYETRLQSLEDESKEARQNWTVTSQLERRVSNLQRYSTNRFFCATVLDALQQVMMDDVRLVQLQSQHNYATNAATTFKTNLVFPVATRKAWQFWKAAEAQPNILSLVSNQIALITNSVEAFKTPVGLVTKVDVITNQNQATANIEIIKPVTAAEQVVLTIKARDYSNPMGRRVDEFSKAIAAHPYFAQRLRQTDGEGIRLRERAIQPELDQADAVSPAKPFVPFVIECRYRDTLRANE
ncbi:MAG: hypothetical protein U1G07_20220 [Verrucomicrobiota bacterium]